MIHFTLVVLCGMFWAVVLAEPLGRFAEWIAHPLDALGSKRAAAAAQSSHEQALDTIARQRRESREAYRAAQIELAAEQREYRRLHGGAL